MGEKETEGLDDEEGERDVDVSCGVVAPVVVLVSSSSVVVFGVVVVASVAGTDN